jgi:hypothetical protein
MIPMNCLQLQHYTHVFLVFEMKKVGVLFFALFHVCSESPSILKEQDNQHVGLKGRAEIQFKVNINTSTITNKMSV